MGFFMGKAEGHGENWHGHVTAVSVGPPHRRLGLANKLIEGLEQVSDKKNCYFVDLFVIVSNTVAINFCRQCSSGTACTAHVHSAQCTAGRTTRRLTT